MEKIIILLGPTASGKTKLSIELAKILDTEIISADSMQIYKYMDIGTAKPDTDEMQGIKHYLIDEVYPDEEFSVAKYQEKAFEYITQITNKGKIPIIVGGTGLYINSLIYNINFSETICDWKLREDLKKEADEKGNECIYEKLKVIDSEAAKRIHPNDTKRIIRAIEVFKHTNKPISYHQEISRAVPSKYEFILIGLSMDRERLYERINKRVDIMLNKGLVDEVKRLVELGYDRQGTAMQGIGYKEILSYLRGEISFEEAVNKVKQGSRNYAKRQLTWFRRLENIFWVDMEETRDEAEILKKIEYYIATFGIFL